MKDKPIIVRTCKCHCGHTWQWPVEFSDTTPKLSGEARRECPKCGADAFSASPWRVMGHSKLREMTIGDEVQLDNCFDVGSSHGRFKVAKDTGMVLRFTGRREPGMDDMTHIVRFDVEEWRHKYPGEELVSVDILDMGYWCQARDEFGFEVIYEPPEEDWRKDHAESRHERAH